MQFYYHSLHLCNGNKIHVDTLGSDGHFFTTSLSLSVSIQVFFLNHTYNFQCAFGIIDYG